MSAARRQLATRRAGWAVNLARWLGRRGVRPNAVSIAGIGFAAAAGLAFALAPDLDRETSAAVLFVAAACIQLRLLCNLLDGMLAVEEGLKSKTGDIYNEVPDRIADVFILIGAGYSVRDLPVRGDAWVGGGASCCLYRISSGVRRLARRHATLHRADGKATPHVYADPCDARSGWRNTRGSTRTRCCDRPRRHRGRLDRDRSTPTVAHRW